MSTPEEGTMNNQEKPVINLRDYIRRDLAYAHGIDRDTLAQLDTKPHAEWSPTHRQWGLYADKAELAAIDWIIGNAPGAIQHLRAAGLYIFQPTGENSDGEAS
jgi:hypothetical protein